MALKEKDFVEIEYTGKVKEEDIVFDTTDEKLAKESGLHGPNMVYGPITVCLGQGHLLKGLDDEIIGKEPSKEYKIELGPEKAFGKKDPKLIQLIPVSKFKSQDIKPVPGLQLNVDGMLGIVKTVSGGRTLVDFNHPLSGKDIVYDIKINKLVEDDKEKLESFIKLNLNLKDIEISIDKGKATIKTKQEVPNEILEKFKTDTKELIPSINDIDFVKPEEKIQPENKNV